MPIDFGKNTGRRIPGATDGSVLAELLPGGPDVFERQRRRERRRMGPPLDRRTLRDAAEDQVYIYNVGPFTRNINTLGSVGNYYIPGLAEDKVLKGLSVAGPVIEQALPELYPSEPPGRVLKSELPDYLEWRDADGEVFLLADRPSIDKALRIIGGHADSKKKSYAPSPWEQGCFVSTIPEQKAAPIEPKELDGRASAQTRRDYAKAMNQYEEDLRLWIKWEKSVESAQARFTAWGLRRGEEQSLAFSNNSYVRDEELYVIARILGKTVDDWKFLAGTSSSAKTKPCWACKRPVELDALRCSAPNCGEKQVSEAEYEKIRKERTGAAA